MEYETNMIGSSTRDVLTKRKLTEKTFFNQATLVIRKRLNDERGWKEVNIKLFANGGVQMTGIISEEFARDTLTWIIQELGRLERSPFAAPAVVERFNVQLVNSDYSVGCSLRRDRLHEILTTEYGIFSLFESTIYQGVNTKYYHNVKGDTSRPGQCTCKTICKGQGTGDGEGQCKRITMSIFQTGNIIITGARNMEQIMIAYDFLNKVLDKHAGEVIRAAPAAAAAAVTA
jgi:TATA-box binding protein (TBP) (component of TFIID and TFIIIB)